LVPKSCNDSKCESARDNYHEPMDSTQGFHLAASFHARKIRTEGQVDTVKALPNYIDDRLGNGDSDNGNTPQSRGDQQDTPLVGDQIADQEKRKEEAWSGQFFGDGKLCAADPREQLGKAKANIDEHKQHHQAHRQHLDGGHGQHTSTYYKSQTGENHDEDLLQ